LLIGGVVRPDLPVVLVIPAKAGIHEPPRLAVEARLYRPCLHIFVFMDPGLRREDVVGSIITPI
jgi:hypothetical protein